MYVVKMFEIVFFFIVKDNNIFPCLHHMFTHVLVTMYLYVYVSTWVYGLLDFE